MTAFSPTQTQSWLTCPMLHHLAYREGWKPRQFIKRDLVAIIGSGVHAGVAVYHRALKEGRPADLTQVLATGEAHARAELQGKLDAGHTIRPDDEPLVPTIPTRIMAALEAYVAVNVIPTDWQILHVEYTLPDSGHSRLDLGVRTPFGLAVVDVKYKLTYDPKYSPRDMNDYTEAWQPRHYCLTPDQRVLTRDLRWVPIGNLHLGETLVGFEENPAFDRVRRFKPAMVIRLSNRRAEVYRVQLSDGAELRATGDHPWLVTVGEAGKGGQTWRATSRLRVGTILPRIFDTWVADRSYDSGWLSGIFDGEGSLSARSHEMGFSLQVAQKPGGVWERIQTLLSYQGIKYTSRTGAPVYQAVISRKSDIAKALGLMRPLRLLPKWSIDRLGAVKGFTHVRVVAVESLGTQDVVTLSTSTGTFIAEGFGSHNCHFYSQVMQEPVRSYYILPIYGEPKPRVLAPVPFSLVPEDAKAWLEGAKNVWDLMSLGVLWQNRAQCRSRWGLCDMHAACHKHFLDEHLMQADYIQWPPVGPVQIPLPLEDV